MENIKIEYTEEQKELIEQNLMKGCTDYEKMQVWHMADKYGLDLMQKGQLWVTGYGNQRNIIVGRDGQLTIAHRQGIKYFKAVPVYRPDDLLHEQNPIGATCVIERADGAHFEVEVNFKDYNTGQALWKTKPSEMITKVAESKCLRRAFDMSGFYSPEEMDEVKSDARTERYDAIEQQEKSYSSALFTARKDRESILTNVGKAEPVETPNVAEVPKPVETVFNDFDLSKPAITEKEMNDMVVTIKCDFTGQTVTQEERDACRRSDGKYDYEAAKVLKKAKFTAWKAAQVA